jgi:hypothetical protein
VRKALRSIFGRKAALATLSLCLFILVFNVEVQGQSSDLKRRESNTARLDRARRLAYHTHFLRQVANSSPRIEVVWNMEKVFPSLRFIAENGSEKDNDAAKAVGSIFGRTENIHARSLCLSALKRIGNKVAKKELLRIFHDDTVPAEWRNLSAEYLQIEPSERSKPVGSPVNVTERPQNPLLL